ncbi:MAG: GGDEF domain-containing protein [Planctomycetaceae bacterium]|jgi:diguanylate cyclase (GGDEF)-like protein|nr:GGDEF domain-containing protein [Planctomycetaceae bacterium]MBT6153223.1 GGDEF domain-containing protein [Planctomycetaceae bacterium]MBT6484583.1 GGDEF domain-containing protein [Planctomycetaceae bacterium]MBT6495635.1 GGDEF domain-containing protein [Planctomycetaceae bacterium]
MVSTTKQPNRPTVAAVITMCALVAVAVSFDVLAPVSYDPGLLYLPVILVVAWRFRIPVALGLLLLVTPIRLIGAANPLASEFIWSVCSWLGVYFLVVLLTVLLRRSVERERQLARTDTLTGLANRTALLERIEAELNRGRRKGSPLSVAYIDCDHFKQINDQHGHAVGDRVLEQTATAMKKSTRNYDLVARTGGDEFVIVLPETAAEETRIVIGRIQDDLSQLMRDNNWDVSFSIGAVTFVEFPSSAADAVHAADELMYAVKQAGKNGVGYSVVGAETLTSTG